MSPRFPNGSHNSILSPEPRAPRLVIGAVVLATCVIGLSSVYSQISSDLRAYVFTTRTARAVAPQTATGLTAATPTASAAAVAPPTAAAPSAMISTEFRALTTSGPLPRTAPRVGLATDGFAPKAPTARRDNSAEAAAAVPDTALDTTLDTTDANAPDIIPLPKPKPPQPKPERRSSAVQVYTTPDGQQVSVHRPARSGDSMFDPWGGFESGTTAYAARSNRRVQAARPGLFDQPF